jgi:hypothetical protein
MNSARICICIENYGNGGTVK